MTTVDRPAQRSAKRTRTTEPRRPRVKPGDDRVVIIDIDGVLADLNAYESMLAVDERPTEQRWEEFFAHIPDAAVIDDDPAMLAKLTAAEIPAVSAHTLAGLTTTELRTALEASTAPTTGRPAPQN